MDVYLWFRKLWPFLFFLILQTSCGNKLDVNTERGRQARIDEANIDLSKGLCDAAMAAIDPVYYSPYVDETVALVKSSAYACKGHFDLLAMANNVHGAANIFSAIAKSMGNSAGDNSSQYMYSATDILTNFGSQMSASQRTKNVNTYMTMLSVGIMGSIFRNYGNPNPSTGAKGTALVYSAGGNPNVQMATLDACALEAAIAAASDSYSKSNLNDPDTLAVFNQMISTCNSAGFPNCTGLTKDRKICTNGAADAPSVAAQAVVTVVNAGW